jgi:RHS repeat-associated protein
VGFPSARLVADDLDPFGAYKTSVAITVPPYHGISPQLRLAYNSNDGNGVLGRGWSLEGYSRIVRASALSGAPSYDAFDSYFLDGVELVPCERASRPNASCRAGGTHTTKIESYLKIIRSGNSWSVWTKDGTRSTYQAELVGGSAEPYRWSLSAVEDTHGNRVDYETRCDLQLECYLEQIRYGAGRDGAPGAVVTFMYQERDDALSYATGAQLAEVRKRLVNIVVEQAGVVVRAYHLTYGSSDAGGSLLTKVQQFGRGARVDADGSIVGPELPARLFTWNGATRSDPWVGDPTVEAAPLATFDSLPDHGASHDWNRDLALNTGREGWFTGDVDGDGREDFISAHWRIADGQAKIDLRVARPLTGGGYADPAITQTPWTYNETGNVSEWPAGFEFLPADVNGDGRTDLVAVHIGDEAKTQIETALSTGDGRFSIAPTRLVNIDWGDANRWFPGDANGDGRADLMLVERIDTCPEDADPGSLCAKPGRARLDTVLFEPDGLVLQETPTDLSWAGRLDDRVGVSVVRLGSPIWAALDVDGDGRTDLVRFEAHASDEILGQPHLSVRVALASGHGQFALAPEQETTIPWRYLDGQPGFDRVQIGDFNGDGRSDFALLDARFHGPDSVTLAIATGLSTGVASFDLHMTDTGMSAIGLLASFRNPRVGQPRTMNLAFPSWSVGDFSGDGIDDLLLARPPENRLEMATWPTTVDLVQFTSDGRGGYAVKPRAHTNWPVTAYRTCTRENGPEICTTADEVSFELLAGDVNGDGHADVVYAGRSPTTGDSDTALRVDISPVTVNDTDRWRATDINGDGLTDFVYVLYTHDGLRIYSSLDDGESGRRNVTADVLPGFDDPATTAWKVADVGGGPAGAPDGRADLIFVAPAGWPLPSDGTRIYTLFSRGDGTWNVIERLEPWPLDDIRGWRTADLDNDGRADLVDVTSAGNELKIVSLFSNGDGSWTRQASSVFQGSPEPSERWLVADVNGDGRADLVQVDQTADAGPALVRTVLSDGRQGWDAVAEPVEQFTDGESTRWQVAQLNGDRQADLVRVTVRDPLGTNGPSRVVVDSLLSLGNGHWTANSQSPQYDDADVAHAFASDASSAAWIPVNANGDGLTDLVELVAAPAASLTTNTLTNEGAAWSARRDAEPADYAPDTAHWGPVDLRGTGADGLAHVELRDTAVGRAAVLRYLRSTRPAPRLVSDDSGLGLRTDVAYSSSAGSSALMPVGLRSVVLRRVSTRVLPQGTVANTTYRYEGERWSFSTHSSLGFQRVTATDGQRTRTIDYEQTPECVGQPVSESLGDGQQLVSGTRLRYAAAGGDEPFTCALTQRLDDDFEYTTTPRTVSTRYSRDEYGNTTKTVEEGEFRDTNGDGKDDYTADNRTLVTTFIPNRSRYIVARPATTTVLDNRGHQLARTITFYDHDTTLAAPQVGDATAIRQWDDHRNRWIEAKYDYDSFGNRVRSVDASGRWTSTTFDSTYGQYPVKSCNSLYCTTTAWDMLFGLPQTETDANGAVTSHQYDAFGREIRTTLADGGCILRAYLDLGNPAEQRVLEQQCTVEGQELDKANGLWTEQHFDGLERPYRLSRAGGATKDIDYLGATQLIRSASTWHLPQEPPSPERFAYDLAGRPIRTTHPDGTFAETRYGVGVTNEIDELKHDHLSYQDARGQTVLVRELVTEHGRMSRHDTLYDYDLLDRIKAVTDAAGHITKNNWDSLDRLVSVCDPDSGCRSYRYDDAGRLTLQTDAKKQRIAFSYDGLGRVSEKQYLTAAGQVRKRSRWFYDTTPGTSAPQGASIGRPTRIVDPGVNGSTSFWYDRAGRTTRTEKCVNGKCVEWASDYDIAGRPSRTTYPDNSGRITPASEVVTTTYDEAGRITRVAPVNADPATYATFPAYDANDHPTRIRYGNGIVSRYAYDADRQWLTQIDVDSLDGATVFQERYHYDDTGRVDHQDTSNGSPTSLTLGSDELGRLQTIRGSLTQNLDYDATGNITFNSLVGTYRYTDPNHAHAVTRAGGNPYQYDRNGNLLSGGGRTLTWNEDNLPLRITAAHQTVTYSYDAAGARVTQTDKSGTNRYMGPLVEIRPDGTLAKSYYAAEMLIARRVGDNLHWYSGDARGSVVAVTDRSGSPVARFNYGPFGAPFAATGSREDGDAVFAGHRIDTDTNLVYMGARYYDRTLGRFVSPDTIVPTPADPQSFNRYTYAANDPLDRVDPSGHRDITFERRYDRWNAIAAWSAEDITSGPPNGSLTQLVPYDTAAAFWTRLAVKGGSTHDPFAGWKAGLDDPFAQFMRPGGGDVINPAGGQVIVGEYDALPKGELTEYPRLAIPSPIERVAVETPREGRDERLAAGNQPASVGAAAEVGWGFGISLDLSFIIPTSGGGFGSAGINIQYLSTGPNSGWDWYSYSPSSSAGSEGVAVGVSAQVNGTWGNGEWLGDFDNFGFGAGPFGGSYFESPGASSTGSGWQGVSFGFGHGPVPFSAYVTRTYYNVISVVTALTAAPQVPYAGPRSSFAKWGGHY